MKLVAVDSNSIMNRAFYGIRLLSNKDGVYTNAIMGFMNIFLKVVGEVPEADYFAFAFDLKGPTFRHEEYTEYKAGRKEMPEELRMQFPIIKELLKDLGYTVVECEGYEADDILGTLAYTTSQNGDECLIVTGDRDCLQLVNDKVTVRLASTKAGQPVVTLFDEAAVGEKYGGLTPPQLIDIKALQGDASDNIPGVAGVGEKTALTLIQNFGSLDGVYKNLQSDKIKPGVRAKLEAGKDSAYLSYQLGKIATDAPISLDMASYARKPIDHSAASALLSGLGMFKLEERLGLTGGDQFSMMDGEVLAKEPATPTHKVLHMEKGEEIGDTLTGTETYLSVCWENEKPSSFAWTDGDVLCYITAQDKDFEIAFRTILEESVSKISWDTKKIHGYSFTNNISVTSLDFDGALAGYLLNPLDNQYTPGRMFLTYGGERVIPDKNQEAIDQLADMLSVVPEMKKRIEENDQEELLYKVEQPLAKVLASMENYGFDIDTEGVEEFGEGLSKRLEVLQAGIYEEAGMEFNINSPKQLGEILFDKMGLPHGKKTKTGYSTNAEVLETLRPMSPFVDQILEYRQLTKLKSTYVDGLLKVVGEDGRVHTKFNQTETRTGRISSAEPNMQNIPVRTELGAEMRKFFHAEPGKKLLDADYSQIELRVLASLADDKNMIDTFKAGKDIHQMTAAQVFHVPEDEVTPSMRSNVKAVNFGIVYGISAFSLSQDIGVSVKEAQEYIDRYLENFSGVKAYMDESIAFGKEKGYVETLFGRRRPLPELKAKNYNERSFGERVAMNMPIQGTAADIIKIAMVRVYERLERENTKARLILQVHDELIIETPEDEIEQASKILQEEMVNAAELRVDLVADVGVGEDWYQAKG